jgi:hypothetical protein
MRKDSTLEVAFERALDVSRQAEAVRRALACLSEQGLEVVGRNAAAVWGRR